MTRLSVAARVQMITDLLGGQDIYDDEGNKTGEKTPAIITKEEAIRLLNSEEEDGRTS